MTEVLLLGVALVLTLACGVFVAAEFSLTTVERSALEDAVERGVPGAPGALAAVRSLTFQLSGAQLGITLTSLVIGMLAEPSVAALLAGPLRAAGVPGSAAGSLALVLGTAVSTVVLMVIGELVPKNWAISSPLPVARRVAPLQRGFSSLFRPFIRHLNNTANRVLLRLGLEPTEELASARSPQELVAMARHSAEEGTLAADTADLFVRSIQLSGLTAQSIMTPRVRVAALETDATLQDVADAVRATGLSRFPVCEGGLDAVRGTVRLKDVLAVPDDRWAATSVRELLREPLLVPDSFPADRLLEELTDERPMAVVIDEYGGTAGVLTFEDIIEEIVGSVRDEHDPRQAPDLLPLGPGVYEADGAVRRDQLQVIGLQLPEGPYETLAGFIATDLGRIPAAGDRVRTGGWELAALRTDHHRAVRVRLTAPAPAPDAEEAR
ncbi:hemolysin family protein [Streptomyces harbinensis]|uniref:Hemolysin, contains CBS domains n=1 Tax=Streptomyces harbinensis TaxID=1176198 RepID=A0A1I6QZQ2_9ACTN|nr:hemolysin family protein [Streptomyces harbinensis]SFS57850.1 Hemolysin, contains CBS domains [Streptomyces harbinensis]